MVRGVCCRSPRTATYALVIAAALALSGCSSGETPDPKLISAVDDAVSAGRSAKLGLELSDSGRIFPTTLTTVLDDMADALADSSRQLALAQPEGDANTQYRDDALAATRSALEAVHEAQQGVASAKDDLNAALDDLGTLAEQQ